MTAAVRLTITPSASVTRRLRSMTAATGLQTSAAAEMQLAPPPPPPPVPPRLVAMTAATAVTVTAEAATPLVLRGMTASATLTITPRASFSRLREPLTSGSLVLTLSDHTALVLTLTDGPCQE